MTLRTHKSTTFNSNTLPLTDIMAKEMSWEFAKKATLMVRSRNIGRENTASRVIPLRLTEIIRSMNNNYVD